MRIELDNGQAFLDYRDGGGGTVEIFDIAVNSDRRQGIGTKLIAGLFEQLPEGTPVHAVTRTSNEIAQQFYEALGFSVLGILRRFYGDDHAADAVMYGRLSAKRFRK